VKGCEETARACEPPVQPASGYENGYEVITLSDCVAATSAEEHDNALKYDYPMFSKPMTSEQLIAELS